MNASYYKLFGCVRTSASQGSGIWVFESWVFQCRQQNLDLIFLFDKFSEARPATDMITNTQEHERSAFAKT